MSEAEATNALIPQVEESVGAYLMRVLFEEITSLRQPWAVTPQQLQQEVLDRLRGQVQEAVNAAVLRIGTSNFTHVAATIESLTIKDGAKATMKLARGGEAIHELGDRVGSLAIIVFADPKEYTDGMDALRADLDQKPLPLE